MQFGLQFGSQDAANDVDGKGADLPTLANETDAAGVPAVADGTGGNANDVGTAEPTAPAERETPDGPVADVVELDAFRKK